MICNKKLFPQANVINRNAPAYGRNSVLRHYNSRDEPKVGQGVVSVKRIPYSYHYCTTQLSLLLDLQI